jgi:hypothetical protein
VDALKPSEEPAAGAAGSTSGDRRKNGISYNLIQSEAIAEKDPGNRVFFDLMKEYWRKMDFC